MITASQTMVARSVGHDQERRGFAMMAFASVLAAIIVMAFAWSMWPPRSIEDTSHDVQ